MIIKQLQNNKKALIYANDCINVAFNRDNTIIPNCDLILMRKHYLFIRDNHILDRI